MQYASFTGFLKTLFIIFLIITLFRVFVRWVMPYLVAVLVRRAQHNLEKKLRNENFPKADKPRNAPPKKDKKTVGEYVDFEEIE